MVLKPNFLHGFKTLFFRRKTEGRGLKPYEKIAFSAQMLPQIYSMTSLSLVQFQMKLYF